MTRRNATTLPILRVDESSYKRWRRAQLGGVRRWLDANGYEPKGNRTALVPGPDGPTAALLGNDEPGIWGWAAAARNLPAGRYTIHDPLTAAAATEAAVGWALAGYRFDDHRSTTTSKASARQLVWPTGADRAEAKRQIEAIGWVRDLVNQPAHDLGPAELVDAARSIDGAKVRVVQGKRLEREAPAIHAVGRGSARGPRLIDLRAGSPKHPRLTLVGKGVCFDSGGLNIKSAGGMFRMKKDMGGAAIVLGLARLIVHSGLPVRLRVLIPAVENLAGPGAYRPGDVIKTRSGRTVEISNTDAEGRVVLADALHIASEEQPELLIDVATLTGSARAAVGTELTPFWTPSAALAEALRDAGEAARDPVWRLPLHKPYRRHLDSQIADLKNSASTHYGGATIAALFLREFVTARDGWVHLDVNAWNDRSRPGRPTGGEATGLRALWRMLKDRPATR